MGKAQRVEQMANNLPERALMAMARYTASGLEGPKDTMVKPIIARAEKAWRDGDELPSAG